MNEQEKIELLKRAITTSEGWKNLAKSIKSSSDPIKSKEDCIKLFETFASKELVNYNLDGIYWTTSPFEMLVQSLEGNLEEIG